MTRLRTRICIGIAFFLALRTAVAQIPSEAILFKAGTNTVTVRGKLLGPSRDTKDYVVVAKAGQTLTVAMLTPNKTITAFNVMATKADTAMYRGELWGKSEWSTTIPADGSYTIRVFLNRAASRKAKSTSYSLTVTLKQPAEER